MRTLVGWDVAEEAELIQLYLNAGENTAVIAMNAEEIVHHAETDGKFDAILMCISHPDSDTAYQVFCQLRELLPGCPIVGACHMQEIFKVAKFLTKGLRAYVPRDTAGDYVFLLEATIESIVEAVRAEREQKIAEKLREEIDSVRKLQMSILPQDLKTPDGYEICASYEPSQIRVLGGMPVVLAGGDYYDVFSLDEHRTVLLVGDAAGHGMKACMSIMTMHTLVRMIRNNQYLDTAAFVSEVNQRLCDQSIVSGEGGFITLLYGILRTDTNEFEWTSAGHPIPLSHCLTTNTVKPLEEDDPGGMPLGIMAEAEYNSHKFIVPPNSRLALFTDGLVEAFPDDRAKHTEFGVEGISQTLRNAHEAPLHDAMQALFDDSKDFTRGQGRHDDTSIVLLHRR